MIGRTKIRRSRKQSEPKKLFATLIMIILLTALCKYLYFLNGNKFPETWQLLALVFPAMIFLPFYFHSHRMTMRITIPFIVIIFLYEIFFLPHPELYKKKDRNALKFLNFNTHRQHSSLWINFCLNNDIDIACLHEIGMVEADSISAYLKRNGYNSHYMLVHKYAHSGSMIISKQDFSELDTVLVTHKHRSFIYPRVRIFDKESGKTFDVAAYHLISVKRKLSARVMKSNREIRIAQAESIVKQYGTLDPEVEYVVGADLNSLPVEKTSRLFRKIFYDCWKESGIGAGASWPDLFPLVRLDYFFSSSSNLISSSYYRIKDSDHLAQVAIFRSTE